jgi:hypothetical protein
MEHVRTVEPFLLGLTFLDKMEVDSQVDEVEERICEIEGGFSKNQPSSTSLKEIMESKIRELLFGYRGA